jgi:hypothetical protein
MGLSGRGISRGWGGGGDIDSGESELYNNCLFVRL